MITKTNSIEKQAERSHSRLPNVGELAQALIRSAGLAIYIVQERKFQYVNPLFQDLTGYTEEELLGTYPLNLVHPDDRETVRKKAIENLKGQAIHAYEYRLIKKNDDLIWVLENLASTEYKGKPATVGSFMDTTERKMAEKALKENEQKLRSLVETTSDWVWEVDQNSIYTYASPKVKDLLGYEPEEGAQKMEDKDREILVGENRLYLGEDNILYGIMVGTQDAKMVIALKEANDKLMNMVEGRVNAFVDLSQAGKPSSESRKVGRETLEDEKIGKVAFFGLHPVARVIASFVMGVTRKKDMRFFKTKQEALAWLRE